LWTLKPLELPSDIQNSERFHKFDPEQKCSTAGDRESTCVFVLNIKEKNDELKMGKKLSNF
jgi:hypothetical protein